MTGACAASGDAAGYIGSVSRFIDCRAEMLDTSAFGTLSAPGSTLSLLLTGFLTIYVALIGYNLLAGRGFSMRSGTVAMVKIGAVLTLVMSWPAYQTLVYDVVVQGPTQLVAEIGRPAGVPGADGTLTQRLDAADGALQQLAILGPGQIDFSEAQSQPPPPMAGFDAFALGGSRILFLISALVGIVSVRIVEALMLAVGPYFIALLLFENTKSMFEGWIRVLAGATLGAVGVFLALGLQLLMLEPWLANVLTRRLGGESLPSMPTELFVTTAFFTVATITSLFASAKVAAGFRLARSWLGGGRAGTAAAGQTDRAPLALGRATERNSEPPSRAALTASVIASLQRRESGGRAAPAENRVASRSYTRMESGAMPQSYSPSLPIGRAFPRRTRARATSSATRRDRTS